MRDVARNRKLELPDYQSLWKYSVEQPDAFWMDLWNFLGIRAQQSPSVAVEDLQALPGARWFPGARLNFAENLLRRDDEGTAIVFRSEDGRRRTLSWGALLAQVASCASALERVGVNPGDRVAGYLPNIPEAVVAMLATTAIGAVWCACSPDYGAPACLDRLRQVEPKVLFAGDRYAYAGREHALGPKVAELAAQLPGLMQVVTVPYDGSANAGAGSYAEFISPHAGAASIYRQLPFDHPALIVFTSGTTGTPKCVVHGAGGILLQTLKEQVLHTDVGKDDRLLSITTTGWMVWNMMVSALGAGATIVLYDGSPLHPNPARIFDLVDEEQVSALRIVPRLIDEYRSVGLRPARTHRLRSLRCLMAGGAPLLPHHYRYVYDEIKADVHLLSPAGGTDIMGSLATGSPISPVYPGEIQVRSLGMKVEVYDANARPTIDETGELVCTQAFPSVPLRFWNDPDGERLHTAYFSVYPNVWRHGDWARITPRGGVIIEGRADATLNVNGVRIGTNEIYRALEGIREIRDCAAVEHRTDRGAEIALFVTLAPDAQFGPALAASLRSAIRRHATPRHVPGLIVAVADLPRSSNGKVAEVAIRDALAGQLPPAAGLLNPETLPDLIASAHAACSRRSA
jgi:acetoacetyl-CoA synthetase